MTKFLVLSWLLFRWTFCASVDKDKAAFPAYGQLSSGGVDFEFFAKTNVTKNNRSGGYEREECPGEECPENKTIR